MLTEFISQGFLPEKLGQYTSQSASTPVLPPTSHQSPKPTYSSLPLPLLPNSPDSFFSLTTSPTQIPANSKDFAASQTSSLDILIAYTHYSISSQRGATLPAVAENILLPLTKPISQGNPSTSEFMSIENLKTYGESLCYPREAFSSRFWCSSARLVSTIRYRPGVSSFRTCICCRQATC